MDYYLLWIIKFIADLIGILLLAYVILSYFMSPYHPVREALSRIVDPMLDPIRRMVPPLAGLDFSPLVLWLVVDLLRRLLANLIVSL